MGAVLIYGGSGGIGAALARRLHRRGRSLHLVARDEARLAALAGELGAGWTAGDVADPGLFARATAAAGALDGLAYAVGSITLKPLARLAPDDFLRDVQLNAIGAALAVQAAAAALKSAGGAVVLFSSVAAAQGFPMHASIGLAKAAVEGLAVALAAELAPQVRVNVVAPSLTRTPLAAGLLARPEAAAAIAALHALPRLGEPDDPAAAAEFLLSPEAGWITGQVLGVDGGRARVRARS